MDRDTESESEQERNEHYIERYGNLRNRAHNHKGQCEPEDSNDREDKTGLRIRRAGKQRERVLNRKEDVCHCLRSSRTTSHGGMNWSAAHRRYCPMVISRARAASSMAATSTGLVQN